jgi:beta-phosphoglucomutase-like phosphatase (HAD superfamily)
VTPLLALFDIDGTLLLGSDPVSNAAFPPALREVYGVDPPPDAVAQIDHPGQTC